MALPPPTLYDPGFHKDIHHQIAQNHAACILQDGTLASFLPDKNNHIDHAQLAAYWLNHIHQITTGSSVLILQFAPSPKSDEDEPELAGSVLLTMPPSITSPNKAKVEKLLVSPKHRRKGVARRLMALLEEVAVSKGRGLLLLDTAVGSAGAVGLYRKLGYVEVGVVPRYGVDPRGGGGLVDEMFFYKDLRGV